MSDSNYAAATRHRKPNSTAGRPPSLAIVDDDWANDCLTDDEIDCNEQENKIQPLLGDLDVDAVLVSTGHSDTAENDKDRRRREEGRWTDLGLDRFDNPNTTNTESGENSGSQNH